MLTPEILDTIKTQLATLSSQLDSYTEGLTGEVITHWMQDLQGNLKAAPELVHLLSDEEIAPLYRAMIAAKGVMLVQAKAPKAPKEKKEKGPKIKLKEGVSFNQGSLDLDGVF